MRQAERADKMDGRDTTDRDDVIVLLQQGMHCPPHATQTLAIAAMLTFSFKDISCPSLSKRATARGSMTGCLAACPAGVGVLCLVVMV